MTVTEVARWYTREQLAMRWRVSEKTVSNWLSQARRAGWGPTRREYRRKSNGERGCIALVRADYAERLWSAYGALARVKKKLLPPEVPSEVPKMPGGAGAQ